MARSTPTILLANDTGQLATDLITFDGTLTGTADPGADLVFNELGAPFGSLGGTTADANGKWTFLPTLSDGAHQIVVSNSPDTGMSVELDFTLDTAPPALVAFLTNDTGPFGNDGITSDATVGGTAEAGATITVTEGAAVLGTTTADSAGAWSVTPSYLVDGAYVVDVTASDIAGNTTTVPITLSLLTAPPSLTALLANDTGASNSDGITRDDTLKGVTSPYAAVSVHDNVSVVGLTTADASGNYTVAPNVSDGARSLVVTATDLAGNVSAPETVSLTLQTAPPAFSIGLANDTGASASDGVTADAALTGVTSPGATIALSEIIVPVHTRIATLFGTGVDAAGIVNAPGVAESHWTLAYGPAATAETPQVVGGLSALLGTPALPWVANTASSAWISPMSSSAGFYDYRETFSLNGYDPATARIDGRWSADDVAAIVLNGQPTGNAIYGGSPVLTDFSIANGFVAGDNTIEIYLLNTQDETPTGLQIQLDGEASLAGQSAPSTVSLGSTTADNTGAWGYTPALADGAHDITATVTDTAGNTAASSLALTLQTTTPLTAGLSRDTGMSNSDGITSDPTLSGTTSPNATVTVSEAESTLGATTADGAGHWSYDPAGLTDGPHAITVGATAISGATGSVLANFTLDTSAPSLTAALAIDDGSSNTDGITTDPTIAGTTTPGATVTLSEAAPPAPVAITSLFSTGLDNGGALLAANAADPHYQITYLPTLAATTATMLDSNSWELASGGPYAPDTANSGWITPNNSWAGGDFIYRTTFSLDGFDPTTARIDGVWSVDNAAAIIINNQNTGIANYDDDSGYTPFSITSGFVSGENTLDFYVYNDPETPTGIQVQLSGFASPNAASLAAQSVLGSTTADSSGQYSLTPAGLSLGSHMITASTSNSAGNTVTVPVNFTLVSTPQ